MGFSGKPSKACSDCRKRRVKCDLKRPACSQCVRKGRVCSGYNNDAKPRDISNSPNDGPYQQPESGSAPRYSDPSTPSAEAVQLSAQNVSSALEDLTVPRRASPEEPQPFHSTWLTSRTHSQMETLAQFEPIPEEDALQNRVKVLAGEPVHPTSFTATHGAFAKVALRSDLEIQGAQRTDQSSRLGCAGSDVRCRLPLHDDLEKPSPFTTNLKNRNDASSASSSTATLDDESSENGLLTNSNEGIRPISLNLDSAVVVERVMAFFHAMLTPKPEIQGRGIGDASRTTQYGQETSTASTTHGLESTASLSGHLVKRPVCDVQSDDFDNEDDTSQKRPRKSATPTTRPSPKRKFACPYFKRDSARYLTRRSCVGPGWDEVRRVKEHLYRNHALPIFCPRCYETFSVDSLLHDHQRADSPCQRQPERAIEGFDKIQEKRLRSRRRTCAEWDEEGKWKETYRILFSHDDESLLPSPYLDCEWEKAYQKPTRPVPAELAAYEQYLRRELPSAVRQELEAAVEREFAPLEEQLRSQLVDIVRDLQIQLFRSYTRDKGTASASASSTTDASAASNNDVPADASGDLQATDNEAVHLTHVSTYDATQDMPSETGDSAALAESTNSFDPVLFQIPDWEDFSDSAYGSLFEYTLCPEDCAAWPENS